MNFSEKLQALRKENQLSQEALAEKMNVSRQAVAKWETGSSFPDLTNLLLLSDVFSVSLDRLVKPDEGNCQTKIIDDNKMEEYTFAKFLFEAKGNTYAANAAEDKGSYRPNSHDLTYKKDKYLYIDTYIGGEIFSGEEAVWIDDKAVWAMNYHGRVLDDIFDGKVLKNALLKGIEKQKQRGPFLYKQRCYSYHCKYEGDLDWFQGYEEIFYESEKIYECYFHGGIVK